MDSEKGCSSVPSMSMSKTAISVGFIIPEQTKDLLGLNQMPLRLTIHPSIHSTPLLHPFMAAMSPVVMVTVSSASLSWDCDLCCQEGKRSIITYIHTRSNAQKHTPKGIFLDMSVGFKAQTLVQYSAVNTQAYSDRKSAPLIIQYVCILSHK